MKKRTIACDNSGYSLLGNSHLCKIQRFERRIKEFKEFSKDIDEYYVNILKQPVPEFDSLKGYVVELNRLLFWESLNQFYKGV